MDGLTKIAKKAIIYEMKRNSLLYISDTTLRDGEQMPKGTLFPYEKVEIAKYLEKIGVHSIDAGFPASCYSEIESVRDVAKEVKKPIITALCRAKNEDIDSAYEALKDKAFNRRGVSIFIGSSLQHREHKLNKSKSEIIDLATKAIQYASKYFAIVSFSPEDASRTEPDFLVELYEKAIEAGAGNIGFTDTVGILNPETTREYVLEICERVKNFDKSLFAIHFHNDLGMAVANSLAAIKTGYVDIFQGTLLGVGERAGNASLEQVVLATSLSLDNNYPKKSGIELTGLRDACEIVARYMGIKIPMYQPIVGENIFRTEAGIHQHGILQNPDTYEIYSPNIIGAEREFVLGKHSGSHAVERFLKQNDLNMTNEKFALVYKKFKDYFKSKKSITNDRILRIAREVLADGN